MSSKGEVKKISISQATIRYGVTQRTIFRWIEKYEIHRFEDGYYNRDQFDALVENYANPDYTEVDWDRAACKDLPLNFFYRIEERGVSKLINLDVFRVECAPCPIWSQCLGYATHHENFGVWGGMTTEERQALLTNKKSAVKEKVFKDFDKQGISKEMILQAIGKL
jgi:hypothetical protein